ncbi:hypothetical protein J4T85_035290 (plasmid) [Sinorhizobium medicae]|uniref:hypothetical protein n=1 Tax=Sinorhizobium medicae TaxID=110321 RepID=UPI001AAE6332|nr:hypothetical protein [Sinorhizobium medicae]MBO1965534.1 hypothetical protein [Sinorhizobium medicae]
MSVVYEPPPEISASIAISSVDVVGQEVRNRCVAIGITNIRVIKRILRFAKMIQPVLEDYEPDVLKIAITSITLFSWSHDQPEQAPPLGFLRSKTADSLVGAEKPLNALELGDSHLF